MRIGELRKLAKKVGGGDLAYVAATRTAKGGAWVCRVMDPMAATLTQGDILAVGRTRSEAVRMAAAALMAMEADHG